MGPFKKAAHYGRYQSVLRSIFIMPIIAILGFLDLIPVPNVVATIALVAFIVGLIVFFVVYKGKNPANENIQ